MEDRITREWSSVRMVWRGNKGKKTRLFNLSNKAHEIINIADDFDHDDDDASVKQDVCDVVLQKK